MSQLRKIFWIKLAFYLLNRAYGWEWNFRAEHLINKHSINYPLRGISSSLGKPKRAVYQIMIIMTRSHFRELLHLYDATRFEERIRETAHTGNHFFKPFRKSPFKSISSQKRRKTNAMERGIVPTNIRKRRTDMSESIVRQNSRITM